MLEKRVIVYLDTGATREHVLILKDDEAYVKKFSEFVDILMNKTTGILKFGTPLCIYKVQNIIAIEFLDPPPPSDTLRMGFV